jgi:cobalt-zinc-cadmium resistance protein CzcA
MLERLVHFALRQRLITLLGALFVAAWGAVSYMRLPIDAFPDVAPIQVLVAMRAPGLTPEELEARVTAPIEIAAKGIPNLVRMRSTTRYSVTLITFEFSEGTDIYWARAQVSERLSQAQEQLPQGVSGGLAPIVTPLGEMLMFTIVGGNLTPTEQRSVLDWTIRPAIRGLPGVADLNVLGGFVRTFEVAPSPAAMAARGVTVAMLESALSNNNRNDGAGRVRDGEEALLVRAEGRLRSLDEIRSVVIAARGAGVVRVGDRKSTRLNSSHNPASRMPSSA